MPSDHGFWETLDLLIGREWKKPLKEDLVHDWVEKIVTKRQMTKAASDENLSTQKSSKEWEKSSGYGSEHSRKSVPVKIEGKKKQGLVVPPAIQCTYVLAVTSMTILYYTHIEMQILKMLAI